MSRWPAGEEVVAAVEAAAHGSARALAQLITLVESGPARAREVMRLAHARAGQAYVVALTGPAGTGKSTLLGDLVSFPAGAGHAVGVVTVDPSSPTTGGALLGDRIRIEARGSAPSIFIRSMASRGAADAIAPVIFDVLDLLDAGGRDWAFLETVGTGQNSGHLTSLADTTVVVLHPDFGDDVQVLKAGILEVADVIAINKADLPGAERLRRAIEQACAGSFHDGWSAPVVGTVATNGAGLASLWQAIAAHRRHMESNRLLDTCRRARAGARIVGLLRGQLTACLEQRWGTSEVRAVLDALHDRRIDPYEAADLFVRGCRCSDGASAGRGGRDEEPGQRPGIRNEQETPSDER